MATSAALGIALIALLVGAALGHLSTRRRRREPGVEAAAPVVATEAALSRLRHDIRGALAPAMLAADRLTMNGDPAVARSAEIVVNAVERVSALLEASRRPIAPASQSDLNSGTR